MIYIWRQKKKKKKGGINTLHSPHSCTHGEDKKGFGGISSGCTNLSRAREMQVHRERKVSGCQPPTTTGPCPSNTIMWNATLRQSATKKKNNNNNNWHRDKLCHRQVSGGGGGQIVAQGSRYREGYRISFFFFLMKNIFIVACFSDFTIDFNSRWYCINIKKKKKCAKLEETLHDNRQALKFVDVILCNSLSDASETFAECAFLENERIYLAWVNIFLKMCAFLHSSEEC